MGVLLTGMGRDGAQGLKFMRQQGFLTIAQDQYSSSVYGMPKAAAAIDAAVEIRPLGQDCATLAGEICQMTGKTRQDWLEGCNSGERA